MSERKLSDRAVSASCSKDACQKKYERKEVIEPEKDSSQQELVIITIQAAKRTVSEDLESGSLDKLQGMLHAIPETSEKDVSPAKNIDFKTDDDLKVPVTRMERGSSPINLPEEAKVYEKSASEEDVIMFAVKDLKAAEEDAYCSASNSFSMDETQPKFISGAPELLPENPSGKATSEQESSPFTPTDRSEEVLTTIGDVLQEKNNEGLTKDLNSIAKAVASSSAKTPKLCIQVMPPVSIRGGLVMQKTLQLSIKPTGSVTNNVDVTQSNVGYEEIITRELKHDKTDRGKCPPDCKSPHGEYCKTKSTDSSIQSSVNSNHSKQRASPPVLDKQTLFLYKSFQVLDDGIYDDHRKRTNMRGVESDSKFKYAVKTSSAASIDSIKDWKYLPKNQWTPWQLGFYKTKATQCNEPTEDEIATPTTQPTPTSERARRQSPVRSSKATSMDDAVDETKAAPLVPIIVAIDAEKASLGPSTSYKETSSKKTSSIQPSLEEETPSSSRRSESAVSDVSDAQLAKLTVQEVLDALRDENTEDYSRDFVINAHKGEKPVQEVVGVKEQESVDKSKISGSSSSSSSSNSSYVVVGTNYGVDTVSNRPRTQSFAAPIRVVRDVGTSSDKNQRFEVATPEDTGTVKSEQASIPSIKVSAPKTDISIQVSLEESSSEESSTDSSLDRNESTSISYFIKGLTGTSREELNKLRSSPSFPRTELASWSRGVLKTIPRDKSRVEVEVEIETFEATTKNDDTSESTSILSEKSKRRRLRELKKLTSANPSQPGDKKDRDDIVMRLQEHNTREIDRLHMSKQHQPFYRRVLSKLIDPSNKKMMKKSLSDPYPIDESVSEGEIGFKSKSRSIGEVTPFKYLEMEKFAKRELRQLKHHFGETSRKEYEQKSVRIARQRTHYNNWVTYYLQKQNDKCVDDSGSSSTFSRSS